MENAVFEHVISNQCDSLPVLCLTTLFKLTHPRMAANVMLRNSHANDLPSDRERAGGWHAQAKYNEAATRWH